MVNHYSCCTHVNNQAKFNAKKQFYYKKWEYLQRDRIMFTLFSNPVNYLGSFCYMLANWTGSWILISSKSGYNSQSNISNFLSHFWSGINKNKDCPWMYSEGTVPRSSSLSRWQPKSRDLNREYVSHGWRRLHLRRGPVWTLEPSKSNGPEKEIANIKADCLLS